MASPDVGREEIVGSLEDVRQLATGTEFVKGNCVGDPEVIEIASLVSLKILDLSGCEDVTDQSVSQLRKAQCLERLDLSFCNQITDRSLEALASLPALRVVSLNWCYSVTDAGLAVITQCKTLESVSLWSCESVTDLGVEALASLPRLRSLELPEFAAITNRALSALAAKAATLEYLRLDHLVGISDQGLLQLCTLKRLRGLTVQGCSNVTPASIEALRQALPECQVIA